uniref:Uncharacterized protein n=1 Tax=Adineta vaga TaxID=104782 RepID=B3G4D6_ADIVA|nr:unknown [Adineta vaga]
MTKSKQSRGIQKQRHRRSVSNKSVQQWQLDQVMQFNESNTSFINKKQYYPFYIISNADPTLFLTDYTKLSNEDFKALLLTAIISDTEGHFFSKLLDIDEIFALVRPLTQLVNTPNYLQVQNDQWNYFYELGITEHIWSGRVSKNMALVNSMSYTYGRSRVLVEQRRNRYKKNLEKIQTDVVEHMKQIPAFIDSNQLMTIIKNIVHQDQYELRMELQRRRSILKFHAKDHELVQNFYKLRPTQTEIHSAKLIWKAIDDEYKLRHEIALFKNWLLTSPKSSTLSLCTFQNLGLAKIIDIFTHVMFDKHYLLPTVHSTTSIEAHSINQFINDIIQETIYHAEAFCEVCIQKVNDEKQKLLKNQEKFTKPPIVDTIVIAIENRQINMIQCGQFNLEQTLKILFPTTTKVDNS